MRPRYEPEQYCDDAGCQAQAQAPCEGYCPSTSFVGWDDACDERCYGAASPHAPFNECCDDQGCLSFPAASTSQLPFAAHPLPVQDCVECWTSLPRAHGDALGGSGASSVRQDETPETSPDVGMGELLGGLDDKAIQEILDCCCCGPESAMLPPTHDCHHVPHQPAHPPAFALPPPGSSVAQTQSLAFLPSALEYVCKWTDCTHAYLHKQQLVMHVQRDHLLPCEPSLCAVDGFGAPFDLAQHAVGEPARCLWDDCSTIVPSYGLAPPLAYPPTPSSLNSLPPLPYLSSAAPSSLAVHYAVAPPAVDEQVQAATESLLQHLLAEHLPGLQPDIASALTAALRGKAGEKGKGRADPRDSSLGHAHSHSASGAHTHVHAHAHRHHGHPYGVKPRSAASLVPPLMPAVPTPTGHHLCRWTGCPLAFASSAELMQHLSADHVGSGQPSYSCEWEGCDRNAANEKGFVQRQKVMRHLQTHTGDRPFVCDVCQKSFSEATTLTQHKRVHTNERPFKCLQPGCEKAFALASALTIHTRTHTGAKPFSCPEPGCTSTFSESSNLSKHIRTHKGEKTHVCDACDRAFARSDQLARHKKIHLRGLEGGA